MKVWYAKAGDLKVREWIEKTGSWVKAGYVSPDVWLDLKKNVRSEVLSDFIEMTSVQRKPENAAGDCKSYSTFLQLTENDDPVYTFRRILQCLQLV